MSEKIHNTSKSWSKIFNEDGSINEAAIDDGVDATDEIIIRRMKELEEAKEMTEKEKKLF